MNIDKYRLDFPILNKTRKVIYFDNAATTLKPKQVIDAVNLYNQEYPANIHRGIHTLSMRASSIYEDTIDKVAKFVNASRKEVIFTNNSTDSINLVMQSLYFSDYFKEGDEIITTVMEHHANFVPWLFLAKKLKLKLNIINIKEDFTLNLDEFRKKLNKKTKLVAITHISNTIATKNPISEIIKLSHEVGSLVLIDGSQSAPHNKIDFKKLNPDFFVFTMHKMLGPTGVGVLVGKQDILERLSPTRFGGDMVSHVTLKEATWNELPYKFMGGTPNISGVFGVGASIDYLLKVGMNNIFEKDKRLFNYSIKRMCEIPDIKIYNPRKIDKQGPIILFELRGIGASELTALLDDMSYIATRAGMHCAEPIVSKFNRNGLNRASFYFYNTINEIDVFIDSLKRINKMNK